MPPLPTQYLAPSHPATCPEDFIGPARQKAADIQRLVWQSRAHDYAPIALYLSGPTGVGKSALTYYLQRLLGVGQWGVHEYNGTDITVDKAREIEGQLHLHTNELFGEYSLYTIHEADKIPSVAQVKMLTLLDNLPNRCAFVCTTNAHISTMEERFQGRFMFSELTGPTEDELAELLSRWGAPPAVCRMIALGATHPQKGGNVRLAMKELQEWLMTAAASPLATPVPTGPAPNRRPIQTAMIEVEPLFAGA